jgi:hypothetical protein
LNGTDKYKENYSEHDKKVFAEYVNKQIAKIKLPNPDKDFLRERILTMYANPVVNKMHAMES